MKLNKYKTGISVALLSIMSVFTASAQTRVSLTLEQAVESGLAASKQLKLSDTKVTEATLNLKDARGHMLPDVSISGSYLRVAQPTISLKTGSQGGGNAASSIKVNEVVYGMANVSEPIFSGLRVHYGIQSAKYLEQAAKLDADKDRDEIVQNIIAAYSNLYKAQAFVALVNENLHQQQQRVKDFINLEKNGVIARNDLLKAQLQESNAELSLMDAENNLKITNINTRILLGLQDDAELVIDSNSFRQTIDTHTSSEWESLAYGNRKDLAAYTMRAQAANANIKATKGEYYPSLALTGGYIAADIPNFLTITNALNGGIGLKYAPSSLWKVGTKVKEAKLRQSQTLLNQEILKDQVRIQINKAYEDYLLSQKKIGVYNQALTQATENYRITKNKYDNSLATTTDLLEADVAQLQAKLNIASARVDAVVAYNMLLKTAGVIDYSKYDTKK